ncbi:MAG: tRNA uridine-5-carboxymethylaminomethyl(34) synthesis enzyme MnmG [Candidatus Aureabacteria bacterium]|nr:tRNA uridine-5-carboxymethylaminomethyl(34) synthesis enzyme MnmG [Candidatus Auribacterota bacterium]
MNSFDILVIGGGHAGIEAVLAAARMGAKAGLITLSIETIAEMSCNPAIGGLSKGHLVREVDALGGEMGHAIDQCGIQFRMLNQTKGPAVWGPRAQADKKAYKSYMQEVLKNQSNLTLIPDGAAALIFKDKKLYGVETESGDTYSAGAVIITTGTFLNGITHRGREKKPEGRYGEKPSIKLAEFLKTLSLKIGRLKTGTPCRLHKDSLDYSRMEIQEGDPVPHPFSFSTGAITQKQVPCYLTHTTDETKKIILENLHLSALYSGEIKGIGPRYCPSIEDKFVKFKDKNHHLLFIEPEGMDSSFMYVNGAASSLQTDVQIRMIRSIRGLEKSEILRVGYAIEYDFVQPTELHPHLELKKYENLFLAGQINGTSGYEEAAAQGIMAGINAVLKLGNQSPFVLKRSEAYTGVLIDDLVTKGVDEPYRMFTSRAEHRLMLRQDTADRRLTEKGYRIGLATHDDFSRMKKKYERIEHSVQLMKKRRIRGKTLAEHYLVPFTEIQSVKQMDPSVFNDLEAFDEVTVFADIKYEGYMDRENASIRKALLIDDRVIPQDFCYEEMSGLRIEARQKFSQVRPRNLGQARGIPGISPADIQMLLILLEKRRKSVSQKEESDIVNFEVEES